MLPATSRGTVDLTLETTTTPPSDASTLAPRATISVGGQQPRPFMVAARISPARTPPAQIHGSTTAAVRARFYFHNLGEAGIAATLEEFSRHLRHCDPAILAFHVSRGDFSRSVTGTT
jgi:hypothetical protein